MSLSAPNFVCVSCEREVDNRWWNPRWKNRVLPPLCAYCDGVYTEGVGEPKHGSMMDRRNAMRLAALANLLRSKAASVEWSRHHGRA